MQTSRKGNTMKRANDWAYTPTRDLLKARTKHYAQLEPIEMPARWNLVRRYQLRTLRNTIADIETECTKRRIPGKVDRYRPLAS